MDRVVKDMAQMSRSRGGEFGIMSLQRKYHRALQDYCEAEGISFEEGIEVLRRKVEQPANSLTTGEWAVLRKIVRMPIPYFLCGLDEYSDRYLRDGIQACESIKAEHGQRPKRVEASKAQLNISDLQLRAEYHLPETPSTKLVMAAFGLEGETVSLRHCPRSLCHRVWRQHCARGWKQREREDRTAQGIGSDDARPERFRGRHCSR